MDNLRSTMRNRASTDKTRSAVTPRVRRALKASTHRLVASALVVMCCSSLAAQGPGTDASADTLSLGSEQASGTVYTDRGFGTDVYAGPFDLLFNKGFAVAQWENRNRRIFDHDYGWNVVAASVTRPGEAVARAGGWREVLRVQALPFYYGGVKDPQWVTNYFGHVFEGGLSFRRLMEWNRAHGLPLPGWSAAVMTMAASVVNEAYETPPPAPGTPVQGNAGIVMDLLFFDPLGIALFSSDRVARAVHRFGVTLWPSQASIVVPSGALYNNGQAVVFKVPLPWTRHEFFLRTGVGVEGGLSWQRRDGYDVSVSVGMQSFVRHLDPGTLFESAEFSLAGGLWVDRDNVLLASLTLDERTDRRVGLNIYPGVLRFGEVSFGSWLLFDAEGRPYFGITGRTLGMGLGIGF